MPPPVAPSTLTGEYFDGKTSAVTLVEVTLDAEGWLRLSGHTVERSVPFGNCTLSDALGRLPRTISLPDGASVVTSDFDTLTAWERQAGRGGAGRLVHLLESKWRWVLAMAAALVIGVVAGYIWGIPMAAEFIAFRLPGKVNTVISEQTLKSIDHLMGLNPSKLPAGRQAELRAAFTTLTHQIGGEGYQYDILFRSAPTVGPNAFALPSGAVVVTDELVALARNDRDVLAVLAHEVTHVTRRHGMRTVLQNSGVFVLMSLVLGDLTSVTTLGATLPTLLAQAGYSRDFEREADRGSAQYCRVQGWGTEPMQHMLQKLGETEHGFKGMGWISDHPEIEERIQALEK